MNGFQGVFIFLPYTCNKRVLNLYMKALRFVKESPTISTTDKSTLAKITFEMYTHTHNEQIRGHC